MEHQAGRTSIDQSAYLSFRPGARLRKAREAQGLALEQVATTLKILPRILQALESDDYPHLPEPVFVRGYLRQYAALLALPADEIVARFDEYYQADRGDALASPAKNPEYIPVPRFSERPDRLKPKVKNSAKARLVLPGVKVWPIAAAMVTLIVVLVVWQLALPQKLQQLWQRQSALPASTAVGVSENTISLPNTVTTMPSMSTLDLRFSGETLVVIRDASGKELANTTKKAGDNIVVTGESPFSIELSNAAAVQFRFNDQAIDLKPYTVNGAVNFRLSR